MAGIPWQATLQHKLGQQLLVPLDDAMGLARRYREVDAFRDYVAARVRLVVPACVLIGVAAIACALSPVMALVGTQAVAALLGLRRTRRRRGRFLEWATTPPPWPCSALS